MGTVRQIVIPKIKCLVAVYFPRGKKRKSRYYKVVSRIRIQKPSGLIVVSKCGCSFNAGSDNLRLGRHMKKKFSLLLLLLLVVLTFAIFFNLLCFQLCPSDQQDPVFTCSISFHSFAPVGSGLSGLFILPLIGLFLLIITQIVLKGFNPLLFKPPQLHV